MEMGNIVKKPAYLRNDKKETFLVISTWVLGGQEAFA